MTTSRQHQDAEGIGQIEDQLQKQADAAARIEGESELDQEVTSASKRNETELDEIIT